MEYDIKFNEKKTVAILFGNGNPTACHLKLNGQPVTWVREVKHLGNIVTSSDASEKTVNIYRHCQ